MNKQDRKQLIATVPSLGARTTTYKGKYIVQHKDPEGPRYVVTNLTGTTLLVTRKLPAARYYIDTHQGA